MFMYHRKLLYHVVELIFHPCRTESLVAGKCTWMQSGCIGGSREDMHTYTQVTTSLPTGCNVWQETTSDLTCSNIQVPSCVLYVCNMSQRKMFFKLS